MKTVDGITKGEVFKKSRKVRIFYLVYSDEYNNRIKGAVDEFNLKMQTMGAELKSGEINDL